MLIKIVPVVMLVALLYPAAPAIAQTTVAYVDLQRALLEVHEGKAAKAKLKKEFDRRQSQLDGEQEDLRRLKDDLDKRASVMDPERRRDKEDELQRKLIALQQTYMQLQSELTGQEKGLTDKIFAKMEVILRNIAKENSIDMILEKNAGVVYATDSMDLTSELIRKYNTKHGKKKKSAKKGK